MDNLPIKREEYPLLDLTTMPGKKFLKAITPEELYKYINSNQKEGFHQIVENIISEVIDNPNFNTKKGYKEIVERLINSQIVTYDKLGEKLSEIYEDYWEYNKKRKEIEKEKKRKPIIIIEDHISGI